MRKRNNKKKVIVNLKKLNEEILNLLVAKYPDGYSDEDVIVFKNGKGETIEAVNVETDDTEYLVKISQRLEVIMEEYEEDEDFSFGENLIFEEPDPSANDD